MGWCGCHLVWNPAGDPGPTTCRPDGERGMIRPWFQIGGRQLAEARSRGVAVHNSWGSGHHALQILLVTALAGCGWMPGADRSAAVPSSTPESRTLEFPTQALPVVSSPTPSPLPPSTPTPACNVSQGTVVEDQYRGHNVQQDVPVLVYLPPCYATMPGPLPVLYLLHGRQGRRRPMRPIGFW